MPAHAYYEGEGATPDPLTRSEVYANDERRGTTEDATELKLCAMGSATDCLELVRTYLKGARRHGAAGPLVEVLERVEDLRVAELRDMRG